MKSWKYVTINKLCDSENAFVQTGPFGSQLHESDYSLEGIPVIMPKDISNGKISTTDIARVSESHVERLKRHKALPGDIVYGRRGDIGRHALITKQERGWLCGTGCLLIRLNTKKADPLFTHYYLSQQPIIDYVANQAVGATMPNLNTEILKRIPIYLPQLSIQRKIAAVLSAYDDLIENNNRRITILEKMAEELYREWFVRLRFPGHEKTKIVKGVPAGWEVSKISNSVHATMGQSPSSEFYNQSGVGLPFNQGVGTYGKRFPKKEIFCSESGRIAEKGDILISVRAPVGRLNIADCKMIIGRGLAALRHKEGYNSYLYYLLSNLFSSEDIIGNGAIFNAVTKDELLGFKYISPIHDLIALFNSLIKPIDDNITALIQKAEILTDTHDRLLSRLMSGKIDVEHLDIQFPDSMKEEVTANA